jgi:hypothetical protein
MPISIFRFIGLCFIVWLVFMAGGGPIVPGSTLGACQIHHSDDRHSDHHGHRPDASELVYQPKDAAQCFGRLQPFHNRLHFNCRTFIRFTLNAPPFPCLFTT